MGFAVDTDEYQNWLKVLMDQGIIPPETRRIIIDLPCDDAAKVYYESFAAKRMFQIDPTKLLGDGVEAISVTEAAKR